MKRAEQEKLWRETREKTAFQHAASPQPLPEKQNTQCFSGNTQ